MNTPTPRKTAALALAAAGLLSLVGCSGGGREYAVPDRICDVPMPSSAVEPLLPDGEKLHQSRRLIDDDGTVTGCQTAVVDGPLAVSVDITELDKPLTEDDRHSSLESLEHARNIHMSGTHWAVQGDSRLHLSTPCGTKAADSLSFRFSFAKEAEGTKATRDTTLRFAKEFVQGEKKKEGCTAS
ncbi:hypothetical protein MMF93_09630 [Streptomyces tubbatahanensis]|uniref:Lipoprotein n=1 Tax=Streptomyces tubbatahanensis TaxID=2923272 RepID=A0ABY3XQW5_9ACTN|nr:hypothetical protein [Streptomyces tubbatahanensis]UNS96744.1 hypothetical protein MMF93_09630 [Streptomyces tubbatahanensis]